MKGTTNGENKKASAVEMVNITLTTDQSSHDALKGTTFTVTYGTYTKSYTWNGTTLTVEIPAYVEYTVTFSDVANHTTPASVTFTAQAGNSRTLNAVYKAAAETLTVTVSGLSSGFVVSVINASTGATIGSQTSSTKTYTIADGIKYYVKASSVSGYATPSNSATRTAVAGGTHSVTMTYAAHAGTTNPTNGVWIQDTDGFYHTTSEWDGRYAPNSVAVITSNCRFGIALKDASDSTCEWGGYGTEVSGITTTSSESNAVTDYDGEIQTTTILNQLGGLNAPAAYYCRSYTFPNGQKGYLGAAGEWRAALENITAIESAFNRIYRYEEDVEMPHYYFYTSTQFDSNNVWFMNIEYNALDYTYKSNDTIYARAFCSI